MELGVDILGILFGVAFVAAFIDAIAGGGGLITIPALLMTGIPPAVALGTNKLQAMGAHFLQASIFYVEER
ncbi:inner membrane protein YfcA [Rodentibacter pneumotropicus]|uniref:Probable membrane transporter protein n=1 Tax=Rodentibacter pneumotropicus TaxID=758 RepID=A0A448MR41_9PAST|nr:inner membrane protein YfcA [Rodentibacter pneumotropicus]